MEALRAPPQFKTKEDERAYLKEKLAASFRILAQFGMDHTIAGHITVRDPIQTDSFWCNPLGLAFRMVTVSDLIQVDHDGNILSGGKPDRRVISVPGFLIHSAIHKARPDVNSVCHSHSTYGKAFSTLGKQLAITTQDACAFYNDIALLNEFGGLIIEDRESEPIVEALGNKKAIIMQNHGILTVGKYIESAVAWYIILEKQCEVQLVSEAAAAFSGVPPLAIDEAQAIFTAKEIGTEEVGRFGASPYYQVIEYLQGHEYKK